MAVSRPFLSPTTDATATSRGAGLLGLAARTALRRVLAGIGEGCLTLVEGTRVDRFGDPSGDLKATIRIRDARFHAAAAFGGSVGAGRAYMEGWWDADDPVAAVRILARNGRALSRWARGPAAVAGPALRLAHAVRRNTPGGSRRNISDHYDLGNEFFRLWLDETMIYSAAVFDRPGMTLAEAQRAKMDLICRKLRLGPADHLLEIGTGWGGFAAHAARSTGCRVTTATISREQYEHASRLVAGHGLADRVSVVLEDYRSLRGRFDKLVSIEMIEAVGAEYLDGYFRAVSERLHDHGLALLQAIVIDDREFDRASRSVDFIKRYIFPGSCIPSVARILAGTRRTGDLRLVHLDDLTPDYAETLRMWRERFLAVRDDVTALGFDEAFLRRWEFYFAYCEGGFRERRIGDVQLLFAKSGYRGAAYREGSAP